MPVNSFDDYPLSWRPDKALLQSPLYRSLAEMLERDICSGRLSAHTKLPPQRELADFLDINLSTVTRAFRLCENKGLIYAAVGRGSFVSPNAALPDTSGEPEPLIQLGSIRPYEHCNTALVEAAKAVLCGTRAARLFAFEHAAYETRYHEAAAAWLSRFQMTADPRRIMIASGTQNALLITLLALFRAGDKIAADVYTYANFISLAKQMNVQLVPVEGDANGMRADALERQSRLMGVKGVYLMPSCANPTGVAMPLQRREEIARVARQNDLMLIEDDAYSFTLCRPVLPIAALLPTHCVYLHGLSKSLAPGLRVAYLVIPERLRTIFRRTAHNVNLKTPLLSAEIATELIFSGVADKIVQEKCLLSRRRNTLFKKFFPAYTSHNACSFFQWVPLPADCVGRDFEVRAQNRGVEVLCSDRFAIGDAPGSASIRIAACSPPTDTALEEGLRILRLLIEKKRMEPREDEFIV